MLHAQADDLQHDREKIEPLRREPIAARCAAPRACRPLDDAVLLEPHQTIGEHVGRDALLGAEEIGVARPALEHQVSDDQQRPGVAKHLEREVDRAIGLSVAASHGWYLLLTSISRT